MAHYLWQYFSYLMMIIACLLACLHRAASRSELQSIADWHIGDCNIVNSMTLWSSRRCKNKRRRRRQHKILFNFAAWCRYIPSLSANWLWLYVQFTLAFSLHSATCWLCQPLIILFFLTVQCAPMVFLFLFFSSTEKFQSNAIAVFHFFIRIFAFNKYKCLHFGISRTTPKSVVFVLLSIAFYQAQRCCCCCFMLLRSTNHRKKGVIWWC